MAAGDDYRIKAADVNAKAKGETSPYTRAELKKLVLAYLRLAEQADRNADLPTLRDHSHRPVQQQQQQPQSRVRTGGDDTE
jgi:TfoX/Sxy family transcriptional regulator of competence genes